MSPRSPQPYVVFDFGGTNLRGGTYDPTTGRAQFLSNVDVPSPVRDAERRGGERTAQERIEAALDYLFGTVAEQLRVRGIKPQAVAVSSRGAFEKIKNKRWWVLRSQPTMEFSPGLVEKATNVVKARCRANGEPELGQRELGTAALTVPAFPLQTVLERLTLKHFGLAQTVPVLQDAAANLLAEVNYSQRLNGPTPGERPALLIVGTGIGLAVLDDKGRPELDANGHGPAISRLVVDEASGLTLTAATNGPALAKRFGKKASDGDIEMINHAVGYLAPVVADQMKKYGSRKLFVTGGVAEGLGGGFAEALEQRLQTLDVYARVRLGSLGDEVGLVGAGAYADSLDLRATRITPRDLPQVARREMTL